MNALTCLPEPVRSSQTRFSVHGDYGTLKAWPDGHTGPDSEPTFCVDSTFLDNDGKPVHQRQCGFRLSTVLCMCACVCMGQKATDLALMQQVTQSFEDAANQAPQTSQ